MIENCFRFVLFSKVTGDLHIYAVLSFWSEKKQNNLSKTINQKVANGFFLLKLLISISLNNQ